MHFCKQFKCIFITTNIFPTSRLNSRLMKSQLLHERRFFVLTGQWRISDIHKQPNIKFIKLLIASVDNVILFEFLNLRMHAKKKQIGHSCNFGFVYACFYIIQSCCIYFMMAEMFHQSCCVMQKIITAKLEDIEKKCPCGLAINFFH